MYHASSRQMVVRTVFVFLLLLPLSFWLSDLLPIWTIPSIIICSSVFAFFLSKKQYRQWFILAATALVGLVITLLLILYSYISTRLLGTNFNLYSLTVYPQLLFVFLLLLSTSLGYCTHTRWRTLEVPVCLPLFSILFTILEVTKPGLFAHQYAYFLYVLFLFPLALYFHHLSNTRASGKNYFFLVFFPLLVLACYPVAQKTILHTEENHGGLLRKKAGTFDFLPVVTLSSKIEDTDTLLFIIKTAPENTSHFLHRFHVSQWDPEKGFVQNQKYDEITTGIKKQTASHTTESSILSRKKVYQEYYFINMDDTAFISMDYPVSTKPLQNLDTSSVSYGYQVTSLVVDIPSGKNLETISEEKVTHIALSPDQVSLYTFIDPRRKELFQPFTEALTAQCATDYDKALTLTRFLHDGDYRYSHTPGLNPEEDPIERFLFHSKKGYCAHFASALALMLRSIDLPSRISVGFYIQPDSGVLGYYPVTSRMAHAWVDVFFPETGWISFDPTTPLYSDTEQMLPGMAATRDTFLHALDYILLTQEHTEKREKPTASDSMPPGYSRSDSENRIIDTLFLPVLMFVFIVLALALLFFSQYVQSPRKQLYRLTKPFILSKTHSKSTESSDSGYAELHHMYLKSKFAPECSDTDVVRTKNTIRTLKSRTHKLVFLLVFGIVSGFYSFELSGQEDITALEDIQSAILQQQWDQALEMIRTEVEKTPDSPQLQYSLGTVYMHNGLFSAASTCFQNSKKLGNTDPELLLMLSETYRFRNSYELALPYLIQYLSRIPDDLNGWAHFGWLCYKTNNTEFGINELLLHLDQIGPDPAVYASLANLYTAEFNYPKARHYYSEAIRIAESRNLVSAAAIYYYNRAILEEIFNNFDKAYSDTITSLQLDPSSSGILLKAELELRKQNFTQALASYIKADQKILSPLAILGIADTYLQAGYPESAHRYINSISSVTDDSWIADYGLTVDQFKAAVHNQYRNIYQFYLVKEKRLIIHNLSTMILSFRKKFYYSFCYWYHDTLYRLLNQKIGNTYITPAIQKDSNKLIYAHSYFYLSLDKWKNLALPYLINAERLETEMIPASTASYVYEKGRIVQSTALLDTAIQTLDPLWERDYLVKALCERLKLSTPTETTEVSAYAYQLLHLNPASFIQEDITLPVVIHTTGISSQIAAKNAAILISLVSKAGFTPVNESFLHIYISENDQALYMALYDSQQKSTIYAQDMHITLVNKKTLSQFVNKFSTKVFSVHLKD